MPVRSFIRPSERRLLAWSLVLILLVVAAVNVPFAVTRMPSRTGPQPEQIEYLTNAATAGPKGWGTRTPHKTAWPAPTSWMESGWFGMRRYDIRWQSPDPDRNGFSMELTRVGWPLGVIEIKQMWWDWSNPALDGPEPDPRPGLLPWGLVGNPVLVGTPLWLAFFVIPVAALVVRRVWRARGGECPWCGYPLEGSTICPECGPNAGTA